ncbi:uncharacterized protein NECHADRAFT_56350, partial [Fusarium vanettenii 77-13-4]
RSQMEWAKTSFGLEPRWCSQPDLIAMQHLIQKYLAATGGGGVVRVKYFAEGMFNKLYTVSWSRSIFLMRVSLPVCPKLKTMSEVATLQFVRQETQLPVPRVIAFDHSSQNELGFEWILMEKMPGVPVRQQWGKLTMDAKADLVKAIAKFQAHLFNPKNRFQGIGNIFQSPTSPSEPSFVLGSMVSPAFFWGDRANRRVNSGPFRSSHDWLKSRLELVVDDQERILAGTEDDDDTDVSERARAVAMRLLELLPTVLPGEVETAEESVLWHDDLSQQNILVAENGCLDSIVDWECVSTVPLWKAREEPILLCGPSRPDRALREDYGEDDIQKGDEDSLDNESSTDTYWIHLLGSERTVLRKFYYQTMEELLPGFNSQRTRDAILVDIDYAVQQCDNELALETIESWLDDRNEGRYWNLKEVMMG